MAAVLGGDEHGNLLRKAGIMGVVLTGGEVFPGDAIRFKRSVWLRRPFEPV